MQNFIKTKLVFGYANAFLGFIRCSKNVVINVDMSSLWAQLQNGPYKNKHTEQHKTCRTPKSNRHSETHTHYFCVFLIPHRFGTYPDLAKVVCI